MEGSDCSAFLTGADLNSQREHTLFFFLNKIMRFFSRKFRETSKDGFL